MGLVSAGLPPNRLGERLVQAVSVGQPRRNTIGERLVRAVAPGDDSQPGHYTRRWSSLSVPTSTARSVRSSSQSISSSPKVRVSGCPQKLADPLGAVEIGKT
jgi:hypothetical protein